LTVNTNHVTAPSVDHRLSLWTRWIALRNGSLSDVDGVLSPAVVAHFPHTVTRAETTGGRSELLAWAAAVRSAFADFELSVQVGPILGVYLIAGRWELTGIVRSGGHWGPSGTVITSSGIDIVRVEGGRIAEFWVNHDSFDFTRALAAR
jgi:hypothetical protein